jgi:hypothetical protein
MYIQKAKSTQEHAKLYLQKQEENLLDSNSQNKNYCRKE